MIRGSQKLKLLDLVDIEFLQRFQDAFAKATGVGSIMVDDKGPITKPSNFTEFCLDTMTNPQGQKKCTECDLRWGAVAAAKKEPVIYTCFAGITAFAVPIIIDNTYIASISGGLVLTKSPSEEHFRKIAQSLGIDEEEYLAAVHKIPIIPENKVKAYADLLFIVANAISKIAHKNKELIEKNKRETLSKKMVEILRATLDSEEIKKRFIEMAFNYFGADRCLFVDYDFDRKKFLPIRLAKLKSPKLKSYIGIETEVDLPEFDARLIKGKNIVIKNLEKTLARKDFSKNKSIMMLKKAGVKSDYALPILYQNKVVGTLVLHFSEKVRILTHDEFDFLKMLRDNVGTALYQAELYEKTKKQIEKEELFRKIIETIRKTLDVKKTKIAIVNEVGKALNADRVFIVEFDPETKTPLVLDKYSEYLGPGLKSLVGFNFASHEIEFLANIHKQVKPIIVQDSEKFILENNLQNTSVEKWFKDIGLKSGVGIPLFYGDKIFGVLSVHYTKSVVPITNEYVKFLREIGDQTGIALYQAKLFEDKKLTLEREVFLRNTIEIIRNSLDINETKKKIVEIIGKTMNADRCLITEYDLKKEKFFLVRDEYLSSSDIKSYKDTDVNKDIPHFAQALREGKELIIQNKKIFLDTKNQNFDLEKEAIKRNNVYSAFACPLFYKEEFLGVFGIHYVKENHYISKEETNLLRTIVNQIAIAIYQAKMYQITQRNAQREIAIRNIIEKAISTENQEDIIKTIVTEEGKLFKADRCFFIEYDAENDTSIPIKEYAEYLSSEKIKTHVVRAPQKEEVGVFLKETKQNKMVVVENIEEIGLPDVTKKMLIDELGVKSYLIAPVFYGDKFFGSMVLHYVNDFVQFTQEEIDMAHTIANQSASTLYQAKLHMMNKIKAEREKILRKIISTAMKTFDFSQIKQIVTDVGKITKADRCYFVETDLGGLRGKPLDFESEYLASSEIKTIIGYQFPENDIREFVELYINAKDLVYFDYENLLKMKDVKYEGIKKYSSLFDLKSGIGVPFMYEGKPVAVLCIEYVKEKVLPDTDELDFLRLLGQQVGIAYTQIKLYKDLKKTAEREKIIGKIISTAISTFDFNNIKKIVKDVGKIANADRCYFVEAIPNTLQGIPVEYENEYLSSPDIKSIKDYNFPYEDVKEFINCYIEAKDVVSFDYESIQNFSDAKYDGIKKYAKLFDLKCSIGIPFFYENKLVAILIIEYVKKKVLPAAEELDFLRILGNQIGMAYSQIKLYNDSKKTAERERILRNISNKIRSSLDIEKIKKEIVTQLGTFFNADRVAMAHYDYVADNYIITPESEYRSSDEVKTFVGKDFVNFPGFAKYIRDFHFKGQNIIFSNLEKYIEENQLSGTGVDEFYREYGFASSAAINVYYENTFLGNLVITFEKQRDISDEEISFLNVISDQIGVAFHQAELYLRTRQQAESESLLRRIIEKIRGSLDIEEILSFICEETAKLFNVQRTSITVFPDITDYEKFILRKEYKSNSEIRGYNNNDNFSKIAAYWGQNLIESETVLAFDDIEHSDAPDYFKNTYIEGGAKALMGTAIRKGNDVWGTLVLTEYNVPRVWREEEKILLKSIAGQIYIAINQAELYRNQKMALEREKINRKIIEILRSTLDKKQLKNIFVRTVGNYFKADRVFLAEYDVKKNMYDPVENGSEFLSSDIEKSFVGYDWSGPQSEEYIGPLLYRKEINIPNWTEYIKNNPKGQDFISLFEDANVKSSYNFPVLYQERLMGYFCIEFTQRIFELEEDDINLIRSICRQCGIALYHAELYQKAQEIGQAKTDFMLGVTYKLKESLREIISLSEISLDRYEDPRELFAKINMTGKNLLEIINEMS